MPSCLNTSAHSHASAKLTETNQSFSLEISRSFIRLGQFFSLEMSHPHLMPPQAAAMSHHPRQLHLFLLLNSQSQVEPPWLNLSTLPSISRSKTQGQRPQALSLSDPQLRAKTLFSLHFYFYLLLYIYFLIDPKSPPLVWLLCLFLSLNSQSQVEPPWLNLSTLPSISRSKTQG